MPAVISRRTMVELKKAIYAHHGWQRAAGESMTARIVELYTIWPDHATGMWAATPKNAAPEQVKNEPVADHAFNVRDTPRAVSVALMRERFEKAIKNTPTMAGRTPIRCEEANATRTPLFWYRPRSDGGYEGPIHNTVIEDVRKNSGAWVPLFVSGVSALPPGPATERIGVWLSAALEDPNTCQEMKDDILAWMTEGQPNVQPLGENPPPLAADHTGWRVDYSGLLKQAREALEHGEKEPALADMLRQLQGHLTELGRRWYAGDALVVDELLQLYCVENEASEALFVEPGGSCAHDS